MKYKALSQCEYETLAGSVAAHLEVYGGLVQAKDGSNAGGDVEVLSSSLGVTLKALNTLIGEDEILEFCLDTLRAPDPVVFKITSPLKRLGDRSGPEY